MSLVALASLSFAIASDEGDGRPSFWPFEPQYSDKWALIEKVGNERLETSITREGATVGYTWHSSLIVRGASVVTASLNSPNGMDVSGVKDQALWVHELLRDPMAKWEVHEDANGFLRMLGEVPLVWNSKRQLMHKSTNTIAAKLMRKEYGMHRFYIMMMSCRWTIEGTSDSEGLSQKLAELAAYRAWGLGP